MSSQCALYRSEIVSGIAIYGTGDVAEHFYSRVKYKYKIKCFVESSITRPLFKGKNVLDLAGFLQRYNEEIRPLIVIATNDYQADIMAILRDVGLKLGRDYIEWQDFPLGMIDYAKLRTRFTEKEATCIVSTLRQGKKLAILYGNCQISGVQQYLLSVPEFREKYVLLHLPAVCSYTRRDIYLLSERFWKYCELFITQHVSKQNRFSPELSSEKLTTYLPKKTNIIYIPNVYFRGYEPQCKKNKRNCDTHLHQTGRFPFSDVYVDAFVEQGRTLNGIIERITQPDFLESNYIIDLAEKSLCELGKREKKCDVFIADYIQKFYRNRQLFYSENHPTNEVLKELTGRILDRLGISRCFVNQGEILQRFTLKGQDAPLYPAVIEALGLVEYETEFYPNRYLWEFKGSLAEYTEEYLRWCWNFDRDEL